MNMGDTNIDATGVRGTFSGIPIDSPLIGRFNAENIAAEYLDTLDSLPARLRRRFRDGEYA